MNADEARQLISLHRERRIEDSRVAKAVRFAENDEALRGELRSQEEFDAQMVEVIRYIQPPGDLWAQLNQLGETRAPGRSKRRQFLNPAVFCAVIGLLLLVGFAAWRLVQAADEFPGRGRVETFIKMNDKMNALELEPTDVTAGQLSDNVMLRGFNEFNVPQEIAPLRAVAWRVFREGQSGHRVAQFVVDQNNTPVAAFVFRASDFGVQPEASGQWRTFEVEGWAAAITERGGMCTVLSLKGNEAAMKSFLSTLKP